MRYEIKGEHEKKEEHVELWLHQETPDSPIELRARRSDWGDGHNYVLKIHPSGTLEIPIYINEDLGFSADSSGKVSIIQGGM